MSIVKNHALAQMRAGKLAIGMGVRNARTVDIAQMAKTCGFDWLFIDCEHSSLGTDQAAQISAASLAVGVSPIVRVPGYEHYLASRMLDNGAQGIVVPHVDDAAMAERAARHMRFPPAGKRSMGGGLQQTGFAAMPVGEVARAVNEETMLVVMIESPEAVKNADAIAAVKGVDAVLIGTNDLCFEMGIPGKFDDPKVEEAYQAVIRACKKHGKFAGMGGLYTQPYLEKYVGMGVQLILSGSDFMLLMRAGKEQAGMIRAYEKK